MNLLNISDNLIKLRHQKGITQEELAEFIGVTKASVSKWETKQSLPDILLIVQLASFFDVTVDELLGYEPQLSREQIQKYYYDLSTEFANQPFEEVMKKCEVLVKKYYSCYPFLFQICVLWINHFMLAGEQKQQQKVLINTSNLCSHIISDCKDKSICNDTIVLKAFINLQCGDAQEVIDTMEEFLSPYRLFKQTDGDSILIQAYQMIGEIEKADSLTQVSMFSHLLALVTNAIYYLLIHVNKPEICEETIQRIDHIINIFQLDTLHPNTAAIFQYQCGIIYCSQGEHQKALARLDKFVHITCFLLDNLFLHGDNYFNLLDKWFEQFDLGIKLVRDKKLILDSAIQALEHPIFDVFAEDNTFKKLKDCLVKKRE